MDGSAVARVTDSLRASILDGRLAPGTRLSQVRLAADHGVSRIPVRDALQVLAGEGLVEAGGGAGTVVVTGMSIAELQELYEMRVALEPVATQVAVPNVGRAEVLQMRRLAAVMEQTSDPAEWLAANALFHASVYRRANRPRMVEMVERLRKLTDRYLHLHLQVIGDIDHLHREHARILEAVASGDAEGTARLTRVHLETSHDFILRFLLEDSVDGGGSALEDDGLTAGARRGG